MLLFPYAAVAGIACTTAAFVFVDWLAAVGVGCVSFTLFTLSLFAQLEELKKDLATRRRKKEDISEANSSRKHNRPIVASARRLPSGEIEIIEEGEEEEEEEEEEENENEESQKLLTDDYENEDAEWEMVDDEGEYEEDRAAHATNHEQDAAGGEADEEEEEEGKSSSAYTHRRNFIKSAAKLFSSSAVDVVEERGDGSSSKLYRAHPNDGGEGAQLTELQRLLRQK